MYLGTMMTVAACSAFAAAGMTLVGRRFDTNYIVARTFYAIVRKTLGLQMELEGEEILNTRPAVLMLNHQSMLDIFVVGRITPKQSSIIAKKSLQYTPLGPFMTMSGAIFLDRGNNTHAVRLLESAGELMKRLKISLIMFPEGTRTSSEIPDMLSLKKGGFHLAIQAGIPIIPVVTENYWWLYHKGVFDEGTIKARVLPPIPTIGLTASDIPGLATRVRNQMLEALHEISIVPPGQPERKSEVEISPPGLAPIVEEEVKVSPYVNQERSMSSDRNLEPTSGSSTSIASSFNSSAVISEKGTETEEDEGMILVGRPT